ncbi:MAG: hypothetical protein HC911_07805 [Chloroflexaceae bacterium]|nr:hypothetical protein [Chloroflexaceae bacterium]
MANLLIDRRVQLQHQQTQYQHLEQLHCTLMRQAATAPAEQPTLVQRMALLRVQIELPLPALRLPVLPTVAQWGALLSPDQLESILDKYEYVWKIERRLDQLQQAIYAHVPLADVPVFWLLWACRLELQSMQLREQLVQHFNEIHAKTYAPTPTLSGLKVRERG